MLQKIREKFLGGVAIAILGLIAVTFVFVGGANFAFIGGNYSAKVDGVEIGIGTFENAYRSQVEANPQIAQLPAEFRAQVRESVLESLIQQQLVDNYLAKAGFQASDRMVLDAIQSVPDFQVDGKFDRDTYISVLTQFGRDPTSFEAQQRQNIRASQLQRAIGATAIVTPSEYRRYLNLAAEQRVARLATLDGEAIGAEIEVSEQDVQAYYDENSMMFQLPETVDLEFIEIRRDQLAESVEISEEALAEYYELEKDRYLQDEQRQARHILVLFDDDEEAAEAKANDLLAQIQGGASFEELAQEHSMDGGTASNGGDLGVLTQTQLPDALGDAIFSMAEGDLEGPVKSDFGFHVIRLDEILAQGPRPLDEVRGELLAEMRDNKADGLFRAAVDTVSDALFDAEDLQAISAASGLPVQSVAGFTREGGEPLGSNQAAIDAIFEESVLNEGRISDIVELDANRSALFKVTTYHEAQRQPLADVQDQIVAAIRASRADMIMVERAERMLQALAEGQEFAAAAEAIGATTGDPVLLARTSEDVDQSVTFAVFTAGKPTQDKPVTGRTQTADGYTIYSVDGVLPGRPESIPLADRDAGKQQLAQESGMADLGAFIMSLRADADIIVNEDVLAAQDLL
jgi:peptidyl-prolyl cis-trans isomerase D